MPIKTLSHVFGYMGIEPWTAACLARDRNVLGLHLVVSSADLDMVRGQAATTLLQMDADVGVQIDRDMEWKSGDLEYIIGAAAKTEGVVAGIYPRRAMGEGWVGNLPKGEFTIGGNDELVALGKPYGCGAGFLAYHKSAIQRMADLEPMVDGGYHPLFCPLIIEDEEAAHGRRRLSDDLAFFWRAQEAGVLCSAALRPTLRHIGPRRYTIQDATNVEASERNTQVY